MEAILTYLSNQSIMIMNYYMYWGEKMSNKATISKRDERLLHTKSGNRCAMCKTILVDVGNTSAACVGENAHIYGEKPDAARYDATKDSSFVNSEQNLIFLCCNCHKKIDTDVASYPANELFALKAQHEQWVTQKLEEKSISYSFAELEVLAKYLVSSTASAQTTSSFSLLKIDEKIKKNSLIDVQGYITMGLSSNFTIADYLNRHPDPLFAAKLTNIMAQKYRDLKSNGLDNYEIFDELWTFASGNNSDFSYKAAGLGILTYFFEKCEVFEK